MTAMKFVTLSGLLIESRVQWVIGVLPCCTCFVILVAPLILCVCVFVLQQNPAQLFGPELASTDWRVHLQPPCAGRLQPPGWLPTAKDWCGPHTHIRMCIHFVLAVQTHLFAACTHENYTHTNTHTHIESLMSSSCHVDSHLALFRWHWALLH